MLCTLSKIGVMCLDRVCPTYTFWDPGLEFTIGPAGGAGPDVHDMHDVCTVHGLPAVQVLLAHQVVHSTFQFVLMSTDTENICRAGWPDLKGTQTISKPFLEPYPKCYCEPHP